MAQYVRLAIDISAGKDVDTPTVVSQCTQQGSCPVSGSVKEMTITGVPTAAFQYKFTLGSWSAVEETTRSPPGKAPAAASARMGVTTAVCEIRTFITNGGGSSPQAPQRPVGAREACGRTVNE